jgi:hypothetical protein
MLARAQHTGHNKHHGSNWRATHWAQQTSREQLARNTLGTTNIKEQLAHNTFWHNKTSLQLLVQQPALKAYSGCRQCWRAQHIQQLQC